LARNNISGGIAKGVLNVDEAKARALGEYYRYAGQLKSQLEWVTGDRSYEETEAITCRGAHGMRLPAISTQSEICHISQGASTSAVRPVAACHFRAMPDIPMRKRTARLTRRNG